VPLDPFLIFGLLTLQKKIKTINETQLLLSIKNCKLKHISNKMENISKLFEQEMTIADANF